MIWLRGFYRLHTDSATYLQGFLVVSCFHMYIFPFTIKVTFPFVCEVTMGRHCNVPAELVQTITWTSSSCFSNSSFPAVTGRVTNWAGRTWIIYLDSLRGWNTFKLCSDHLTVEMSLAHLICTANLEAGCCYWKKEMWESREKKV